MCDHKDGRGHASFGSKKSLPAWTVAYGVGLATVRPQQPQVIEAGRKTIKVHLVGRVAVVRHDGRDRTISVSHGIHSMSDLAPARDKKPKPRNKSGSTKALY
jgi:hypothetical protein